MTDSLIHFPIYIGDALKKFIEYPTLEERGAWISIVVAMIHNDGELPSENDLYRHALIFEEKDKQSLSKALAKLKKAGAIKEVMSLIHKQKDLRKIRQEAGKKGGKKSKKNKQSLSNSESESESELKSELKSITVSKPPNVSEQTWQAFTALRKKKKAPLSDLVITRILGEADKAGVSLEEAIQECCERGWTSFKADWYNKSGNNININRGNNNDRNGNSELNKAANALYGQRHLIEG